MAFASSIRLQYADDADDLFREYKSPEGAPVEFRIAEVTSIAVVNLPTSIDVRYFRLVIQDYSVAPCLGRMKMMCCTRSECLEVDECASGKNGDCQQKWINNPGGFVCSCDQGYDLFVENGTAGIHILESETGVRDGDLFRINKICVKKMCPAVCAPQNGHGPVTTLETFGDQVKFHCRIGFVMVGSTAIPCTAGGTWNASAPECLLPAQFVPRSEDESEGLTVARSCPADTNQLVPYGQNISLSCNEPGRPLAKTQTVSFNASTIHGPASLNTGSPEPSPAARESIAPSRTKRPGLNTDSSRTSASSPASSLDASRRSR